MAKKKTLYSVHPSSKMAMNVIANMQEKTGRTLDEWVNLAKKKAPADEKAVLPGSNRSTDSAPIMPDGSPKFLLAAA